METLAPTKGYCLLVDIVDSIVLKDQDIKVWTALIHNTFRNVETFLPPLLRPLKGLGDSLMFFVSETALDAHGESALTLFNGLAQAISDRDRLFCPIKAAAVRGEAYEITFLRGREDVYGKDIDLTARLLSHANPHEIVMNALFESALRDAFAAIGNQDQFPEVSRISGPTFENLRGFAQPVEVYRCQL